MPRKNIKFIREGKEEKKNVDIDKKLFDIRQFLKLDEKERFVYFNGNEKVEYKNEEEKDTKLNEIIKDDTVYIITNYILIIKQKNQSIKTFNLDKESNEGSLAMNSTLEDLRRFLPQSLRNEDFLYSDPVENNEAEIEKIKREDEKNNTIEDIINDDIIWMSGEPNSINLKNVGSIKIDHSKSVFNNMDYITKSDKNIIFFGSVGAGKTTLTNVICGTDFETANYEFSKTRNVQFAKSLIQGDCIAIDFPGMDSVKDQINHFKIQQLALSVIPVRMICFVIKLDERHDHLLSNINYLKEIFEDYKDNTVIIITHSEPIYTKFNKRNDIELLINNNFKYKKNRIIFSRKNIDYDTLFTKNLKLRMEEMVNIPKMIIKSAELINQMKIIGNDALFSEQRKKFQENFKKTLSLFESKFEEYKNNNDIKRALFFALKLYKNKHIRKYEKAIRSNIQDTSLEFLDKIICELILYSNRIHNQFMDFIQPPTEKDKQNQGTQNNEKPIKKFNIGLQLNSSDTNNEYNKFKECPYCGTVWFRYTGCYNVFCGKRGTKGDKITGCFNNYIVELKDDTITVGEHNNLNFGGFDDSELGQIMKNNKEIERNKEHKNSLDYPINFNLLTEEEKKDNEKKKQNNETLLQPIGCGNRFDWNSANDVTEKIIEILGSNLKQNCTDYYSDVLQIKRELKVKSYVGEITSKLNDLKRKTDLTNSEKDEKQKIENIIAQYEKYKKLKEEERENLDEIKENSSVLKDGSNEKMNNRIKQFELIVKLLKEVGYHVLS